MTNRFGKVLFYLTLLEAAIAFVFIFIHLNDNRLEFAALVLAAIDLGIAGYYVVLAFILNALIKRKKTPLLVLVSGVLFNLFPIAFYLHLLNYI